MKLYAQHGYGDGQKTLQGLEQSLIDGVIFSPKDIPLERLTNAIAAIPAARVGADILVDPQYYATMAAIDGTSSLGSLDEDYDAYFKPRRRSQLLSERLLRDDLAATLRFQAGLGVTALIAPNILIPRSFDSAESAISMDFLRNTGQIHDELGDPRPVYATLAVSRDALVQRDELMRFLNDLTALDSRPAGFYVLIAVNRSEARAELYNADVIAGWMLINHVLRLSGYDVVNGYSDILTPFLGAVGGMAGATGWWSNLRAFSMDRFAPPTGGGRLPIERYLSCILLNRITFFELDILRGMFPTVLNRLPTDALYPEGSSQPGRAQEVLQSWDAIRQLNQTLVQGGTTDALRRCLRALEAAQTLYDRIGLAQPLDPKSNEEHIEPLQQGVELFTRLAELDLA